MMSAAAVVVARRTAPSLLRSAARSLSSVPPASTPTRVAPSAKALALAEHDADYVRTQSDLEDQKSEVQKYREEVTAIDPYAVYAVTTPLPDPVLPDVKSEVAALDPAHKNQIPLNPDGSEKIVTIMQEQAKWPGQSPLGKEKEWIISFGNQGETAETWTNPLMGWVSGADPMASNMRLQMKFDNAEDARYFCEKRGWKYEIAMPIIRRGRDDGAQYQDCFLPQAVAGRVRREGKKCDQWYREASMASHYVRPLKFHGDGTVRQHGPNRDAPIEKDVESVYKMR